jgi:hypothetical protein
MSDIRYAFWEYDQFPFVLSGEIIGREDSEGRVRVKGYDGMRFTPLRVISGAKGKIASDNLERLKGLYQSERDALKMDFCGRALEVAPFLKNCKRTSAYDSFSRSRKAASVALAE